MPHLLHVVSHTHWDREWYLTFQQFRLRLVDLIDHVLDLLDSDPEFRHFNLDAQTIVLEDYLQIRPHARPPLEKYIREGRLTVGPCEPVESSVPNQRRGDGSQPEQYGTGQ